MTFHWFTRSSVLAALSLGPLFGSLPSLAAEPRVVIGLEDGWRFKQSSGLDGVEKSIFDDANWQRISLPHTWNRLGNQGSQRSPETNTVQGVGWYRLHFKTPSSVTGRRAFLQFDGVGAIAMVWLNGHFLGKHEGAFSRFRFDASAALHRSGDNLLVVQADNSKPAPGSATEHVIPLSGDFFVMGGIYRGASLIVTNAIHVDMMDFGGPGLYAHVTSIDPSFGRVEVVDRLVNDGSSPRWVRIETTIEDTSGEIVAKNTSGAIRLTGTVNIVRTALQIAHPRLWQGTKNPYLYRIVLTVRSQNGVILDRVTQPLGLRTMTFDANRGFFLNGEHLFLKGVARHQDRPIKGWAISRADIDEDFDILTDMGANSVRLAHYQHDQEAYTQADRRGIVVWAEIPLVNQVSFDGSPPSAALVANARQQLTELIRQNYNHPSIALWSIANEVDLKPTQTKGPSKPGALLTELNLLAKSEDPGRATTLADCCEMRLPSMVGSATIDTAPRDVIVGMADTIGYNRYFGWYSGKFGDLGPMLDEAHARRPGLPIGVSEYGAGAALTQHTDNPLGGSINAHGRPHPEEFQNLFHELSWQALKGRPYIWGVYVWNMFDFSTASRDEGDLTDINDKGLVSFDRRTRKDAFYFYRANWSSQPTLHLVGRRYVDRPYGTLDVKAYSNAARARLSLNGIELGNTECDGGICVWKDVRLASGPNDLRATAEVGGATLSDSMRWMYLGTAGVVRIKAGDLSGYVTADGQQYGSDNYFEGGAAHRASLTDAPSEKPTGVATGNARLYDSYREGEFVYRIPVPTGRYRVDMKFVEPSAHGPGERSFDVDINGLPVLKGFDIYLAAGGNHRGVDYSFETTVKDGKIAIAFRPQEGGALVSALSITPLDRQ